MTWLSRWWNSRTCLRERWMVHPQMSHHPNDRSYDLVMLFSCNNQKLHHVTYIWLQMVRLCMPRSLKPHEDRLGDVLRLHRSKLLHDIVIRNPPPPPILNQHPHLSKSGSSNLSNRNRNHHPTSVNLIRQDQPSNLVTPPNLA